MFTKNLLFSALVALSSLTPGVVVDARASKRDKAAYPEIEKAF